MEANMEVSSSNEEMHRFVVNKTEFIVPTRYQLIRYISTGAYGSVCAIRDLERNTDVAIKKVTGAFNHLIDSKRTLREIILLRKFKHENVMLLHGLLRPPQDLNTFEDVYMVTELMDTDLDMIIKSPQALTDEHCQYFLYQILRGLKYIHSANVLHRDLKPSNLLLNRNCDLKICDFGLARHMGQPEDKAQCMTEYVATRWYRAPEVILSWKEYTTALDIWSVGCIFAEILGRRPLFPGRDYLHQLRLIISTLGTPGSEQLENINSEKAKYFIEHLPYSDGKDFDVLFAPAPGGEPTNPAALALLQKMLIFDPDKRMTCEQYLCDPYLLLLHDPKDEPVYEGQLEAFSFETLEALDRQHVKSLIYKESMQLQI